MNYSRILVAALAATVVFFTYGFLVDGVLIAKDYIPYPEGVYRSGDAARSHTPFALAGIYIAILVFATICAKTSNGGGVGECSSLGLLFGIFMAGASWLSTTARLISAGNSRWNWRLARSSSGHSSAS